MKKILVVNPKGGCGKTTVATNLASYYALWEVPVALVDYDPQKSSMEWVEARARDLGPIAALDGSHGRVSMGREFRRVIMDAPARTTKSQLSRLFGLADVVIVPAAGSYLRDDQWEDLKAYLDQGRTAVLLPGESFPKHFRALEKHDLMQSRFLGLAGNTNERQQPYHLSYINPSSRLSQTFADAAGKDLFLVNVYRYVRLQPSAEDTVLMSFENGEPALLSLAVGQGTAYASTFAFDPSWTDLPLRNSFLPLVRELVQEGFDTDRLRNKLFMEEAFSLSDPVEAPSTLELDGQYVEINVNPSESVAGRVDTEQWLPALLSQKPLYAKGATSSAPLPGAGGKETSLWPWLLMIALLCLFLESLITGMKDTVQPSALGRPDPA